MKFVADGLLQAGINTKSIRKREGLGMLAKLLLIFSCSNISIIKAVMFWNLIQNLLSKTMNDP